MRALLADIDEALLAGTADRRLDTFVVHVPVIGGAEKHIAPAATLLHNERVKHYWNASGEFGGRLSAVAGLSSGDKFVYAWDVWLIYGPDARWEGRDPPKPDVLMHQLPGLRGRPEFPRLDGEQFAPKCVGASMRYPRSPTVSRRDGRGADPVVGPYMPSVRPHAGRNDACRRVPVLLRLHCMRGAAAAEARRLLRVLLLRLSRLPARTGGTGSWAFGFLLFAMN